MKASKILLALSAIVAVLAAFMYDADTITLKVAVIAMIMCYITGLISFLAIKRLTRPASRSERIEK